jgi:NDP-sugar pyrophosphorylase family protein
MKAGIIAAGRGERFVREGILIPKPLLPVRGEPMIARMIRAAATLKVNSIACVVNDLNPDVTHYLKGNVWPAPLDLIVKTTSSSMESLFCLAPLLKDESFILFTVDSIFSFKALKDFAAKVRSMDKSDGALAITRFVDDEKPLWVKVDSRDKIIAMGDEAGDSPYVTAGFYYFRPNVFGMIDEARSRKLNALRQFLGLLIKTGFSLHGVHVPKTIDVDYPEDLNKAEAFLTEIEGL